MRTLSPGFSTRSQERTLSCGGRSSWRRSFQAHHEDIGLTTERSAPTSFYLAARKETGDRRSTGGPSTVNNRREFAAVVSETRTLKTLQKFSSVDPAVQIANIRYQSQVCSNGEVALLSQHTGSRWVAHLRSVYRFQNLPLVIRCAQEIRAGR
jgi:hypothetical protein